MRMNEITVEQMRIIVRIADEGGFTPAAGALNLSQSSLSRTVALVERVIGTRLFDRTTRTVALTAAGTEFVRTAVRVVENYDRSMNNFAAYLSGPSGRLRLATLPSLAATLLPSLIDRFHQTFPRVTIDLMDLKAAEIIELCRDGTVDLAITAEDAGLHDSLPASFRFSPVAEEEFACILPENHPLADRRTVRWSDLAGQPFVSFTSASSVRRITDRTPAAAGIVPSQSVSAGTISAVAGLCAAGLGLSAVPGFVIPMTRVAGVEVRPLTGGAVTRRIGILQDADRVASPAVEEFLALLRTSTTDDVRLPDFTVWTGLGDASSGPPAPPHVPRGTR